MRSKSEKRLIAEDLFGLYSDTIKSSHPRRTNARPQRRTECRKCGDWFFGNRPFCEKCRKPDKKRTFSEQDKSTRRAFMTAARLVIELDADAREFIVAQFAMYRAASAYHGKTMIPSPHQLGTLAAEARFRQYKAREDERLSRVDQDEEQDEEQRWYVEERKLRGYARMQRRDPVEVLTEQPEQFSRDFLKHKDVWDLVRDLWEERQRS